MERILPRICYFDNSVFGGVFDEGLEYASVLLFDRVRNGEIICMYSDLSLDELRGAPQRVRDHMASLPREYMQYIEITDEMETLADLYLEAKVVGQTSRDDCKHIAAATVSAATVLVSWNFKHIVNLSRIEGYNSVNMRFGYPQINIYSPAALLKYENND